MPKVEGIKCVLLDIEGTICPISFVKDTLFPYALNALPEVLANKWDDEEFKAYRDAFPEDARQSSEKLQAHVEDLTKRDVKIAYLKNLQGYLWETGYKTGAYSTPLFEDVSPRLKKWNEEDFKLVIYSSGNVFAQKLLFEHVNIKPGSSSQKRKRSSEPETVAEDGLAGPPLKKHAGATEQLQPNNHTEESQTRLENGQPQNDQQSEAPEKMVSADRDQKLENDTSTEDLRRLMFDWFDTTNAGLKTDSASYEKIANYLELAPRNILFLSDNVNELDAAAAAGMNPIMVDRPGNAPLSDADRDRLQIVNSLVEVELAPADESSKKSSSRDEPDRRQSQRLKAKATPSK